MGLTLALPRRREQRWALWLQVLPLFPLYVLRNDMRYFALLTPALAYASGLAFGEAWAALSRFGTSQRAAPALAVSAATSLALAIIGALLSRVRLLLSATAQENGAGRGAAPLAWWNSRSVTGRTVLLSVMLWMLAIAGLATRVSL